MADITKTIEFVVKSAEAQTAAKAMDQAVAQTGETAKATAKAVAQVGESAGKTAVVGSEVAGKAALKTESSAQAMEKAMQGAVDRITGLSIAKSLVGGLLSSVGAAADLGMALGQASARFNVPIEDINKYRSALGLSAEDAGALTERMRRFGRTDADIARVSDEMAGAKNSAQRMAIASRLLGAEWAEKLAPALLQGGDAMRTALAQGAHAGGMTLQAAKAFREMDLAMNRVKFAGEGLVGELAVGLAPIFRSVATYVGEGVRWFTEFARKVDLTRLMGVGAAVGVGTLAAALGGPLITAIGGAVKAWGPWGIAVAGAVAAGDDMLAWINGDASLIGTKLAEWFGPEASDTGRQFFYGLGQAAVQAFATMGKWLDIILSNVERLLSGLGRMGRLLGGADQKTLESEAQMEEQVRTQRETARSESWDAWGKTQSNAIANRYEDVRAKVVAKGGTVAPRMLDTAPVYGPAPAPASAPAGSTTTNNAVTIYASADPRQISDIVSRELRTNARMAASNSPGAVPQRQ